MSLMAYHLEPGPRGFAVLSGSEIVAGGLTQAQALQIVRGDQPEPKFKIEKGSGFALNHWPFNSGGQRADAALWEHFKVQQDRKAARWFAHWQAAGPY